MNDNFVERNKMINNFNKKKNEKEEEKKIIWGKISGVYIIERFCGWIVDIV